MRERGRYSEWRQMKATRRTADGENDRDDDEKAA